jgi:hypothetical protein
MSRNISATFATAVLLACRRFLLPRSLIAQSILRRFNPGIKLNVSLFPFRSMRPSAGSLGRLGIILAQVLQFDGSKEIEANDFDLCWSRIHRAREWLAHEGLLEVPLCTASLRRTPIYTTSSMSFTLLTVSNRMLDWKRRL